MALEISGLDEVIKNLNKEIEGIKDRSSRGLRAAALIVEAEAVKKAPADTGNLRGSANVRMENDGQTAVVSFSSEYALAVHENIEQPGKGKPRSGSHGNYWDNGEPKYLENAVKENTVRIVKTIATYAELDK